MADKFTKKAVASSEAADAWKDTIVEKEMLNKSVNKVFIIEILFEKRILPLYYLQSR